ncbi:Uncharacterized protein GBIM_13612, partial [Gryllus bimaculatus]
MADPSRLGHAIAAECVVGADHDAAGRGASPGQRGARGRPAGAPGLPAAVRCSAAGHVADPAVHRDFSWRRAALRVSLLAGAVLLALASPRLPLVMGLLGAAVTGPLSLVLPPLLHARLLSRLHAHALPPDDPDDADGDDAK